MFGQNTGGFGQSTGFGGVPNSGGGFGQPQQQQQQPQSTGFGGGFGGQQNQGSSLFGGAQQNTGFGGGATSGFGQTTQGFGGQTAAFGGASAGFGGQQSSSFSSFGGNNNAGGGGLFANQQKPAGGLFGQQPTQGAASIPFGQQPNQSQGFAGQTAQQPSSLFGGNSQVPLGGQSSIGGTFGQTPNMGGSLQQQPGAQQGGGGFYKINAMPQLHSQSNNFQYSAVQIDDAKGAKMNLRFRNIRIDDSFQLPSATMIRLADMMSVQKGQPEENPEFKGQQAWYTKQAQYPLMAKLNAFGQTAQAQPFGGSTGASTGFGQQQSIGQQQSTGFGQNQSAGFGQSTGFGFNQQQQQPQQTSSLFGGQQQQSNLYGGASTGLGQAQSTGFGQTSAFGLQNASQGFNKPPTSNLYGGQTQPIQGGLFGQQPQQNAAPGGLYGQQPNQQQSLGIQSGNPLFQQNNNLNTQQPAGGGLFGQTGQQPQQTSLYGQPQQTAVQPNGGGLFGQNNQAQNTGGGLFGGGQQNMAQKTNTLFGGGASTAPSAGTGGGLFGNNQTPQPQAQGGLFGGGAMAQTNPSGGGLFGAQPAQVQNTGGLFGGQSNTQQQTGGLFGSKPATTTPAGGLFGAPQQQQPQGGLFGTGGSGGGGLFGGNTAQPAQNTSGLFGGGGVQQTGQTGGLFGGGVQQPNQTGGGLFGNNNAKPAGGLFGQQPQAQNQTGGLFGAPATAPNMMGGFGAPQQQNQMYGVPQQQNQMSQMLPNIYDLYNRDPLGLEGGFLQKDTPVMQFEDEMEKIRQGANNFFTSKTQIGNNQFSATFDFGGPVQSMHIELCKRPTEADIDEEERYLAKLEMKQREIYDPNFGQTARNKSTFIKQTFSQNEGYKTSNNRVSDTQISALKKQKTSFVSPLQPQKQSSNFRDAPSASHLKHKDSKDRLSYMQKQMSQPWYQEDQSEDLREAMKPELVNITAVLKPFILGNEEEKRYFIQFHQTWEVSDVVEKIQEFIKKDFNKEIPVEKIRMLYQNALLNNNEALNKIVSSQDVTFQILIDPTVSNNQAAPSAQIAQIDSSDWRPKAPLPGHQTEPSFDEIQKMSKSQLEKLSSFKIKNQFGEISFQNPRGIDITGQDLSYFEIIKGEVSGYDDSVCRQKPTINTKLNIPTLVTLIFEKDFSELKLKKFIQNQNMKDTQKENGEAEHLSYADRTWEFKVPHWSRWGLDDDSEDEEEIKQEVKAPQPPVKKVVEESKQSFQISVPSIFTQSVAKQADISIFNQPSAPAKYGSPAYSQKFGGQQQISLPSSQRPHIVTKQYLRRKQMLQVIEEKEKSLQEINKRIEVSSNLQIQKDMQELGVKKNPMHMSVRGVRPCFRPNGEIMTIVIKPNAVVAKIQKITEKEETQEIPKVMLKCVSLQDVMANNQQVEYGDFFRRLMDQTKIPQPKFESSICQFLKESAVELLKSEKHSDFYIACLLNALYGDPRIHLAHMHPLYTSKNGTNSFEKAWSIYSNSTYFDQKNTFETSKQRRNAVTEVFRLICQKQYPAKDPYGLLLNGDVGAAVRLLGQQGKHSLARCVAQAVSAQSSTKQRISILNSVQGGDLETQKIIDLITFDEARDAAKLAQNTSKSAHWHQSFCSLLLYQFDSQISLTEIISKSNFKCNDILYTLLKMYISESTDKLNAMSIQLSLQSKWLIHQVLRRYEKIETENNVENKIGVITCRSADTVTARYVDQLVMEGGYKEALIVTMTLQNQVMKKRLMFDVQGIICQNMWNQPQNVRADMEGFLQELHLPLSFVKVHVAWRSPPEIAIGIWQQLGNFQDVHDLLISHLPLNYLSEKTYFKQLLDTLKNYPISNWRENGFTLLQLLSDRLDLTLINDINSKLYKFGTISMDKERMQLIQRMISERLIEQEVRIKCSNPSNRVQEALISELAVQNCRIPDLIRRMVEQNQNNFIKA